MKDYNYEKADNSHYSVPSWYGKVVREEYNMRSKMGDKEDYSYSDSYKNVNKRNEQCGP